MSSQLTFLKEVQATKFLDLKAGLDLNVLAGCGADQWSVAARPKNVQMWTVVILSGLPRDTSC